MSSTPAAAVAGAPDPVLVEAVDVLFNYRVIASPLAFVIHNVSFKADPSARLKAEQLCNGNSHGMAIHL